MNKNTLIKLFKLLIRLKLIKILILMLFRNIVQLKFGLSPFRQFYFVVIKEENGYNCEKEIKLERKFN